ncbi:hypothetical protein [Cereibacter sphaeroides]|uniref:hypothetical protein n=1 Tax=Cereibacter sphaeroides TaxID=1063 RepID=UPI00313D4787
MLSIPLPRVLLLLNAGRPFFNKGAAGAVAGDRPHGARAGGAALFGSGGPDVPTLNTGLACRGAEAAVHDPEDARAALAVQGGQLSPDGVLEQDGRRFGVELMTCPDRPELPLIAAALPQKSAETGLPRRLSRVFISACIGWSEIHLTAGYLGLTLMLALLPA